MINIDMPEDVRRYVLEYQAKIKGEKGRGQYSQQDAIIAIIRDHKILTEKNKRSDSQGEQNSTY
jgi:hypothetical protein